MPAPISHPDSDATVEELRQQVQRLQDQHVDEWLDLIRYGSVIPLQVERTFSWRVTKPFRLVHIAWGIFRREGAARMWTAFLQWSRRFTGGR